MELESVKNIAAFVGIASAFILAIRHIWIAYINKNKEKKLRFKNKRGEVDTFGDLTPHEAALIKEFFAMESVNDTVSNKQLPEHKDN